MSGNIFTARIRSTREGKVFTSFVHRGGEWGEGVPWTLVPGTFFGKGGEGNGQRGRERGGGRGQEQGMGYIQSLVHGPFWEQGKDRGGEEGGGIYPT